MIAWINEGLARPGPDPAQPARLAARRLTREEYRNSVRLLLGSEYEPGADFPADEAGWTYSNEPPSLDVELAEKYAAAAEAILQQIPPALNIDCARSEAAAAQFVADVAQRAFRRPLVAAERGELEERLAQAVREERGLHDGIRGCLHAVLTAPQFLYQVEYGPTAPAGHLRQFELAARLSFLLWGCGPDDELLAEAQQGTLTQNLEQQTLRMLNDPRSAALTSGFANFWLRIGQLEQQTGHLDPALVQAMRLETQLFVRHIVQEDRRVLELLDADYSFLNERLAQHYGVAGVRGEHMRHVNLSGSQRGGILTHGSVLATNAGSSHTSFTRRGRWVLNNILGKPAPPPPVGLLEAFKSAPRNLRAGTPKEIMAQHSADASCAHCHAPLDGLGITLENFDYNGAWRTEDGAYVIDAVGKLPSGEVLNGPEGLKAYLVNQPEMFVRCMINKLLTYAVGRPLRAADSAALELLARSGEAGEIRFSTLLLHVVQSPAFQRGCFGIAHGR
jgi:hypothetical protein